NMAEPDHFGIAEIDRYLRRIEIMAPAEIESRLAALEAEVALLKQRLDGPAETRKHWVDEAYGAFAGDPDFLEAMRVGRNYRQALRAEPRNQRTKRLKSARVKKH